MAWETHAEIRVLDAAGAERANYSAWTLITTAGRTLLSSGNVSAQNGVKLGGELAANTPPALTGAGAALVAYLPGTNRGPDAGYPIVDQWPDAGTQVEYRVTYPPGSTALVVGEIVIVTDANRDRTSTAADTIARAVTKDLVKQAAETMVLSWTYVVAL